MNREDLQGALWKALGIAIYFVFGVCALAPLWMPR